MPKKTIDNKIKHFTFIMHFRIAHLLGEKNNSNKSAGISPSLFKTSCQKMLPFHLYRLRIIAKKY